MTVPTLVGAMTAFLTANTREEREATAALLLQASPDDGADQIGEALTQLQNAVTDIHVARLARIASGGDTGEEADANALREAMGSLSNEVKARLRSHRPPPPLWTGADKRKLNLPPRTLSLSSMEGSLLDEGEICVLSGEGGVGKSALAREIALAVTVSPECLGQRRRTAGGLIDVHKTGSVCWFAYEEHPRHIMDRLEDLAIEHGWNEADTEAALTNLKIRDMSDGWPLYGPAPRGDGSSGLYTSRPERLEGWRVMEMTIREARPALVVIDPALSAFLGDPNNPSSVREFYDALRTTFRQFQVAGLILAHSTKDSRKKDADPFDPGKVSGSGAWTDAARAGMVLDYEDDTAADPNGGLRRLAVLKANNGPTKVLCTAHPRRATKVGSRRIVGFHHDGEANWQTLYQYRNRMSAPEKENRPPVNKN